MNITKKAKDFRPILQNVFYDENDNAMKATDSFRALTYKSECEIERSFLINPITMVYQSEDNYPNLNRLNDDARYGEMEIRFASGIDLQGLKKLLSDFKKKETFIKVSIDGKSKEVSVRDTKNKLLKVLEVESVNDEKGNFEFVFTGLYFYNMIEFLVDYKKAYKNKLTVHFNNESKPILITDDEWFCYLLSPVRMA